MKTIEIHVEALKGDKVMVKNYRRGGLWELGEVLSVDARISKNAYYISYRVMLLRKSTGQRRNGMPLFLTVGEEAIESCTPKN